MSTGFKQPDLAGATLLGRVWLKGVGPSVVAIRSGEVVDITAKGRATASEVLALADPVREVREAEGERLEGELHWLAPCDLQTVKACISTLQFLGHDLIFVSTKPAAAHSKLFKRRGLTDPAESG